MKFYYINEHDQRVGPIELEELLKQQIYGDTLVWKEGLTDWVKLNQLENIINITGKLPPKPVSEYKKENNLEPVPTIKKGKRKISVYLISIILALSLCGLIYYGFNSLVKTTSYSKKIIGTWQCEKINYDFGVEETDEMRALESIFNNSNLMKNIKYSFKSNGKLIKDENGYEFDYLISNDSLFVDEYTSEQEKYKFYGIIEKLDDDNLILNQKERNGILSFGIIYEFKKINN